MITGVDLMDGKITTENEENKNNEENKEFVWENTEEHINVNMSNSYNKFHKTQEPVEEVNRKNEQTDDHSLENRLKETDNKTDDSVIINTEEAINVNIDENCNNINKTKQHVRYINTNEKTDNTKI
ncbi:hypothetical protein Zmor_023660 [Zophobas morio]|uniref:Uncharacterized protein n=1 Tax=Zophobas morio TaxID=2755281 RepID=A0AA38I3U0_9CUCU|nr:hypothetical protein Zmor_023660 [Zophobas morio]